MSRNTIRRVEVAAPIEDEKLKKRIMDMFGVLMRDTVKARIMQKDGTYVHIAGRRAGDVPLNSQEYLYDEAYKRLEDKQAKQEVLRQNREKSGEKAASAKKAAAGKKKTSAKSGRTKKTSEAKKPERTAKSSAAEKTAPAKRGRPKKAAEETVPREPAKRGSQRKKS